MGEKMNQDVIKKVFEESFGRTPLNQRLDDIFGEAVELKRFTDLQNLKEEVGDLICSAVQLCNECDWDVDEVVVATLKKIKQRQDQYHTLGRKISVAILGGAFDPPTKGHFGIAQYVLNTSRTFDEVWLMPCWRHMYSKDMASPEQRLQMVRDICKYDGRIKPFDYEIKHQLSGETYQTIKMLQAEDFAKNKYDFSWIIGMDNANAFDRWVNYQNLEKMIRFVVVPRTGVERDPKVDWYLKPPHIFLGNPDHEIGEVSSTLVRDSLQRNLTVQDLIYPETQKFVLENQLYGSE
jgi:nicotinate-nucleotide adenylyltransferase